MKVRILGPVGIERDGVYLAIDVPKERALLSTLALEAARPVTTTRLIAALWGEDLPESAEKTLQWHISKLRKTIGADKLVTESSAYALEIDPESVDALRFERLVNRATEDLRGGRPHAARNALAEAAELWRGFPLDDAAESDYRLGQQARFRELHDLAGEARCEAEIAIGNHREATADLEALVAEHPYRERPWHLLMLALYRSGRQAEALRSYQRFSKRLGEDLGMEPSGDIRRLEDRILRQDPQLGLKPPPPPDNLPTYLTSFVGRAEEMEGLRRALATHRCVSLVGAGGIGKSRLAAEGARSALADYPDGAWWVDLAPIRRGDDLGAHTATTLGAPVGPGSTSVAAIATFLANRSTLIVLDNCEHLRSEAATLASELLAAGPGIRVLTTTRAALDIPGEYRTVVPSLETSWSTDDRSERPAAVRLFLDRSERAGAKIPSDQIDAVADLCRRIDGVPLAVELAAARSRVLTPDAMAAHLTDSIDLPGVAPAGVAGRHESLEAVLDWSYGLLHESDRQAFDRLASIKGDFDLPTARAVAAPSNDADATGVVSRLLDASMLIATEPSLTGRRFRLLEPMRLFGLKHLDAHELIEAERRHCAHFKSLASRTPIIQGSDTLGLRMHAWREDHNLTAAIEWSLANEDRAETLRLASLAGASWYHRGEYARNAEVLGRILDGADGAPERLRSTVRNSTVWSLFLLGRAQEAFEMTASVQQEAAAAGDAENLAWADWSMAHMLFLGLGDVASAMPLYAKAIDACERDPGRYGVLGGLRYAGRSQALAVADIPHESSSAELDEAERHLTRMNDPSGLAHVAMARSFVALREGDIAVAHRAGRQTVRLSMEYGDPTYEQIGHCMVAFAAFLDGEIGDALDRLFASTRICQATHNAMQLGVSLQGIAAVAAEIGEHASAARLWGAGTTFGASWPLLRRIFERQLDACRTALGSDFDAEVEAGTRLAFDQAVTLAATITIQ